MAGRKGRLRCYFPGKMFPALSVTGGRCALGCSHCEGRLLRGMTEVSSPDALMVEAERVFRSGGTGYLISGGCDPEGKVPLLPFVGAVSRTRRSWGLATNLHPGLLSKEEASELVKSEADCYSIDVHQSESVIRDILHLSVPASAYSTSLGALESSGAKSIVPHVTVGLDDGEDTIRSIELASEFSIDGVVVLVFTPLRGTSLSSRVVPSDAKVLRALEAAKSLIKGPIMLGCMRPRGNSVLEISAIKAGVTGIAMPSIRTIEWANANGMTVERLERCCAVHL